MMRALAFHTERLQDDRVWKRLLIILTIMRCLRSRATFFIYPFRALVAGRDISDRVKVLAVDYKQESGQHTHFYAGSSVNKLDKRNDLSPRNIQNCIERDFKWLSGISEPKGFSAGGWIVTEAVFRSLVNLGFDYDCSARVPSFDKGRETSPDLLWLPKTEERFIENRSLILVPTTHTLRQSLFRERRRYVPLKRPFESSDQYQLVYLHDYDLLRAPVCIPSAKMGQIRTES